jgi:CheY-like chemotaxis protein
MNKNGPIIVIEDDEDDRDILDDIFQKLAYPNKIHFFPDGEKALQFLNQDEIHPFLILSDINMPKIDGFELRKLVFGNEQLSMKCIPYLFFTTGVSKKAVLEAYAMSVQGFFHKPSSVKELELTVKKIIEYWQECFSPNHYE